MGHPGHAPLALVAKDGQFSWWQWLKAVHGFQDAALKAYNQGRFKPVVHLLADHGFSTVLRPSARRPKPPPRRWPSGPSW
jgi:hypothetical protein